VRNSWRATVVPALFAACAVALILAPAAAQTGGAPQTPTAGTYAPKLTEWGDPDLRGVWPLDHLAFLPLQRPRIFRDQEFLSEEDYEARQERIGQFLGETEAAAKAGRMAAGFFSEGSGAGRRTSMIVDPPDGQLPEVTLEGRRRAAAARSLLKDNQSFDWVNDFDTWPRCITVGFPAVMLPHTNNNGLRIFQSPGYVVIDLELIHDARIIPIGEGDRWPAGVTSWMGDSRGRWEGSSLVIETTNIRTGATPINNTTLGAPTDNSIPMSDKTRVVERLTMTGPDSILYEMTYDDPVIWTAPFTVRLDWRRDQTYRMFEYACHEGNEVVRDNILGWRATHPRNQATSLK
jgi:hypothetical protein